MRRYSAALIGRLARFFPLLFTGREVRLVRHFIYLLDKDKVTLAIIPMIVF